MRTSTTSRWLVPPLLGIAFGMFLADAGWWHRNNGVLWWILKVPLLYPILYYPSALLFYLCRLLHIGPGGNAAWSMFPWCVVAFWATFGLLIGLWLLRRQALATYAATHPYTGLDAASLVTQVAQVRQDYVAALHVHPHPTPHRSWLLAQARRVLARLPYFRRKLNQPALAGGHETHTHMP
jgi:hypothetical protein